MGENGLRASLLGGLAASLIGLGVFLALHALIACALGAALYAAGVGHNVPFIAIPSAVVKMWTIMMIVTVASAGVLVGTHCRPFPTREATK